MLSEALRRGRDFLEAVRNADGAWPYIADKRPAVEPTCYAALALRGEAVGATLLWLTGRLQDKQHSHLQWEQSLTLLAFQRLGAKEVSEKLSGTLLQAQPAQLRPDNNRAVELDAKLRGWPWVDGTFSWVEPTSYAILALKAAGHGSHPRVREGERLLLDRVCFDGGWNYGNPRVLGEQLEPMMPTTALAAMALQQVPSAAKAVDRALHLLDREAKTHPSSLSLALTILCFGVFDQPATQFVKALAGRQQSDGSWRGQVHLTALATLALQMVEGGTNVFQI